MSYLKTSVSNKSPTPFAIYNLTTTCLNIFTTSVYFELPISLANSNVFDKTKFNKLNLCTIVILYMSYLVISTLFQKLIKSILDHFCK